MIGPLPEGTRVEDIKRLFHNLLDTTSWEIKPCAIISSGTVVSQEEIEDILKSLNPYNKTKVYLLEDEKQEEKAQEKEQEKAEEKKQRKMSFGALRVKNEIEDLMKDPGTRIHLDKIEDNFLGLNFSLEALNGTCYAVKVDVGTNYPFEPPLIKFVGAHIPHLKSVGTTGDYGAVKENWRSSYTIRYVLNGLVKLMDNEHVEVLEEDDKQVLEKGKRPAVSETTVRQEEPSEKKRKEIIVNEKEITQNFYVKNGKPFCGFCQEIIPNRSGLLTHAEGSTHCENMCRLKNLRFKCKNCESHFLEEKKFLRHALMDCAKLSPF